MITLNALLKLMPYTALTLDDDAFVQVIDHETGAHYRRLFNELVLGGDPVPTSDEELLGFEVTCIEYIYDKCVISVKAH